VNYLTPVYAARWNARVFVAVVKIDVVRAVAVDVADAPRILFPLPLVLRQHCLSFRVPRLASAFHGAVVTILAVRVWVVSRAFAIVATGIATVIIAAIITAAIVVTGTATVAVAVAVAAKSVVIGPTAIPSVFASIQVAVPIILPTAGETRRTALEVVVTPAGVFGGEGGVVSVEILQSFSKLRELTEFGEVRRYLVYLLS